MIRDGRTGDYATTPHASTTSQHHYLQYRECGRFYLRVGPVVALDPHRARSWLVSSSTDATLTGT
jgi:hypothetical protein